MPGIHVADAFDLLADETRIRILQELGRARGGGGAKARSYSDLMKAVEAQDSGRFNYHLTKLRDHFVKRSEDGYALTYEGVLVYRSVIAGTWSDESPAKTIEMESQCHECQGKLSARPDDHILSISCDDCETKFLAGYLPPRGYTDRSEQEILDALNARIRYQMRLIARSVCPWCYGTTSARIVPVEDTPLADRPIEVVVRYDCHQCEAHAWMTVGQRVLNHPAIVSFYYDQGVDVTTRAVWELPFAVTDRNTNVRDMDPPHVDFSVKHEREELWISLDETASITNVKWDN